MINKNVHLLLLDNDILFAEEPYELLMLLYAKDKQYKSGEERIVNKDDFAYWLTNFLGKFKLKYTEKALEHILENLKDKNKRVKAFKEEIPVLLFNELYLRMQPEILYGKLDKDSIQGLIDLLMLKIPDKEYAKSLIKQLVDEINHNSFGSIKIKS